MNPNYKWFYAISPSSTTTSQWFDRLVKVSSVERLVSAEWSSPGVYLTEADFIPRPKGTAEDDGVLVSILYVVISLSVEAVLARGMLEEHTRAAYRSALAPTSIPSVLSTVCGRVHDQQHTHLPVYLQSFQRCVTEFMVSSTHLPADPSGSGCQFQPVADVNIGIPLFTHR
jgi:hypothetical protein